MTRPVITIPKRMHRFLSADWHIDVRSQQAGVNLSGVVVSGATNFPRWVAEPSFVFYRTDLATWQGIIAHLQGMFGIIRMPMLNPVATYAVPKEPKDGVTFGNGQSFSSGVGFLFDPFVVCEGGSAKGATSMTVSGDVAPVVGQIMSRNDWPFRVTSVTEAASGSWDITFQMPLREAIADQDRISHFGYGLFELTEDQSGRVSYTANHHGRPSLSLREALNR
ncbi:MAG: hypothetical protein AAF709_25775 [Pseudomonadota bacterium]